MALDFCSKMTLEVVPKLRVGGELRYAKSAGGPQADYTGRYRAPAGPYFPKTTRSGPCPLRGEWAVVCRARLAQAPRRSIPGGGGRGGGGRIPICHPVRGPIWVGAAPKTVGNTRKQLYILVSPGSQTQTVLIAKESPRAGMCACTCAYASEQIWPIVLAIPAGFRHAHLRTSRYIYYLMIHIDIGTVGIKFKSFCPRAGMCTCTRACKKRHKYSIVLAIPTELRHARLHASRYV
jgi:hypothetical protein